MKSLALLLCLFTPYAGLAQRTAVHELPEFIYRPVSPRAYRWKEVQPSGTAIRFGNTITAVAGTVYSFGGFDTSRLQRDLSTLSEGRTKTVEGVHYPGEGFMHNIFFSRDALLYIGGGRDSGIARYSSTDFWQYDLRTAAWTRLPELPFVYADRPFIFEFDGQTHVLLTVLSGPDPEAAMPVVFRFEHFENSWTPLTATGLVPMLRKPAAFLSGDELFVLFGRQRKMLREENAFFRFHLRTRNWTVLPRFPGVMRDFAFSCGDGRYGFVGGGLGKGSSNLRDVYRFDPAENRWAKIRSLPAGIRHAQCWKEGNRYLLGFGIAEFGFPSPVFELEQR